MLVWLHTFEPLKNNYTWEDVAREHLGLMIDERSIRI